jgi:hypothetical protein
VITEIAWRMAAIVAGWLLAGAIFMTGVYAVHQWIPAVPPIGYMRSLTIMLSLYCLSLLYTMLRAINLPRWNE